MRGHGGSQSDVWMTSEGVSRERTQNLKPQPIAQPAIKSEMSVQGVPLDFSVCSFQVFNLNSMRLLIATCANLSGLPHALGISCTFLTGVCRQCVDFVILSGPVATSAQLRWHIRALDVVQTDCPRQVQFRSEMLTTHYRVTD